MVNIKDSRFGATLARSYYKDKAMRNVTPEGNIGIENIHIPKINKPMTLKSGLNKAEDTSFIILSGNKVKDFFKELLFKFKK